MTDELEKPEINFENAVSEAEFEAVPTPAGEKAAEEELKKLRQRSFSQRHSELGKMINCKVCHMRHRMFEKSCQQHFVIELTPPENMAHLTMKQIFGAQRFNKKRLHPHNQRKKNAK